MTRRLTVAQALVRFLAAQYTERDGVRAAADRRLLRHLRARQRRRRRPGAAARPSVERARTLPVLPGPQRAGHGARRGRLRAACATGCRRSRARRRSARARPTWSPAPRSRRSTGCRCCCCPATSSPPARRSPVLQELEDPRSLRRLGQRRLPAGVALLRPDQPARAARRRRCWRRCACSPTRPRPARSRSRCRRTCRPRRTTGRRSCSRERVWHVRRPVPEPERAGRRPRRSCAAPARPLIVAGGGTIYAEATEALRALAEATGIPVAETQAGKGSLPYDHPQRRRRDRRHRHDGRQRARPRGRRGARRRHALERLHDRLAQRLRRPGRALRQPQRRAGRRPQARRRCRWSPTRARGLEALARGARRAGRRIREHTGARPRARRASGTRRSSAAYTLGHEPLPAQSEVHRRRQPASAGRATSWSARPARCPATCTSCGARATRRATTSSTATRAWATRSPAGSA